MKRSAQSGPKSVDLNLDDLSDDIDWAELQSFFLGHLQGQLDQMDAWLRQADTEALGRVGHSLKGSGGGVRLPRFTDLGRDLESAARQRDLTGLRATCVALREEYLRHRPEDAGRFGRHFES
jgi:HPt (histidine-containing phosphotransfer) domain-containing protein